MTIALNTAGYPKIDFTEVGSTTPRFAVGTALSCIDPYFGALEVVYGQASVAISAFSLCSPVVTVTTSGVACKQVPVPNTSNSGGSLLVALGTFLPNEYGWFCRVGVVPVRSTASVAAGATIGLTGAGTAGTTTASKQIQGVNVVAPATTTLVKTAVGNAGTRVLRITDSAGWFIGMGVTGTGIPASTTITGFSPDGRQAYISNNLTAAPTSVTGSYTAGAVFFNLVQVTYATLQGQLL